MNQRRLGRMAALTTAGVCALAGVTQLATRTTHAPERASASPARGERTGARRGVDHDRAHVTAWYGAHALEVFGHEADVVATDAGLKLRDDGPGDGTELHAARHASDGLTLHVPGAGTVTVVEEGLRGDAEQVGDTISYARDGGRVYWVRDDGAFEEWLSFERGRAYAGRVLARWRVAAGRLRQVGTSVVVDDPASGRPLWVATAPVSYDRAGRTRPTALRVVGDAIELEVDADGEPVLVDPRWVAGPTMRGTHANHVQLRLADGRVFVAGGEWNPTTSLSTAEVWQDSPTGGAFSSLPSMQFERAYATGVVVPVVPGDATCSSESVVLFGGESSANVAQASVERFCFARNQWLQLGSMTVARDSAQASLFVTNGRPRVLITGGINASGGVEQSAEVYDPTGATASVRIETMETSRRSHVHVTLPNGDILVAGGLQGSGFTTNKSEVFSVLRFADNDSTTSSWTNRTTFSTGVYYPAASIVDGPGTSDAYVVMTGGFNTTSATSATNAVAIYAVASGTWSDGQRLQYPRARHQQVTLPNGNILVIAGQNDSGGTRRSTELLPWNAFAVPAPTTAITATPWLFDTSTPSSPILLEYRLQHRATVLLDGTVLVTGGRTVSVDSSLASTERYYGGCAILNGGCDPASACTDNTDGSVTCGVCPAGTSSISGTGVYACTPCASGTYQDLAGQTSCKTWSPVCPTTQYQYLAPTATRDRTCRNLIAPCETRYAGTSAPEYEILTPEWDGTQYVSNRKCALIKGCTSLQYVTAEPTFDPNLNAYTSDFTCAQLTVCASGEWAAIPPTATYLDFVEYSADRVCQRCTTCAGDVATACTATADTVCVKTCDAYSYLTDLNCGAGESPCCVALTLCGPDQYQSVAPTATSDRVCTNVRSCDADEYQSYAPDAYTDRVCSPITVCTPDQYEEAAPTATSDRICRYVTTCTAGQFESARPTPTSDRICLACRVCGPGTTVMAACTATSDTVCSTPSDAGLGVDASSPTDGGVSTDAATGPDVGGGIDEAAAGCGCAVAGARGQQGVPLSVSAAVALAGLLGVRRARRKAARRALGLALLAGSALALGTGCGDEPRAEACVRDPAAIAARRSCRADDDCPCGSGCELGVCVAACADDSDCAGSTCDRFGRCRDDSAEVIGQPRANTVGSLALSAPLISLGGVDEQEFTVSAVGAPVPTARIAVGAAVVVSCDDGVSFGSECVIENVMPDAPVRIRVRPAPGRKDMHIPTTDSAPLTLSCAGGTTTGTVTFALPPAVVDPAAPRTLHAGTYAGTVTQIASGVDVRGGVPEMRGRPVAYPVRAELHVVGSGHVLAIDDPSAAFAPTGRWVGGVSAAPELALTLPATSYFVGGTFGSNGPRADVVAEADPATLILDGEGFHFEVLVRMRGVTGSTAAAGAPGDRSLAVRYLVVLRRTGDLAASATLPPIPPAASSPNALARLDTAIASNAVSLEREARAALVPPTLTTVADRLAALRGFQLHDPGAVGNLGLCALSSADLDALAKTARYDVWGTSPDYGTQAPSDGWMNTLRDQVVAALAPYSTDVVQLRSRVRVVDQNSGSVGAGLNMPCELDFTVPVGSPLPETRLCGGGSAAYDFGRVDRCAAMQDAYGCTIEVAPAGSQLAYSIGLSSGHDFQVGGTTCTAYDPMDVTVQARLVRTCRMPIQPEACAELALCTNAAMGDSTLASSRLQPGMPNPNSGDLYCPGATRSLVAADLRTMTAQQLVTACAADLRRLVDVSGAGASGVGNAKLSALFDGQATCFDAARLVTALGIATQPDRLRRSTATKVASSPVSSRVAQRILQRIAQQLAFTAREAASRENLAAMLRADTSNPPPGGRPALDSPDAVVASIAPFWDLVLHPRTAVALDGMEGDTLATPDYRDAVIGAPVAGVGDSVDTSFAVDLIALLGAEMQLLERRLEWAALDRDVAALGTASKLLRTATLVRALTRALVARAEVAAGSTPPAWLGRYDAAERDLLQRELRITTAVDSIVQGRNPLGIEEEDMPIYYFDSSGTPAERYFAVSDYLMGPSGWLTPLLDEADARYASVRDGYFAQLDREFVARQSNADLAARTAEVRADYALRLSQICRMPPTTGGAWPDSFDVSNCYRNREVDGCSTDSNPALPGTLAELSQFLCVVDELDLPFDRRDQAPLFRFDGCASPEYPVACPSGTCLRCTMDGAEVISPFDAQDYAGILYVAATMRDPGDLLNAQEMCARKHPGVSRGLLTPPPLEGGAGANQRCFNGTLGEAIFAMRSAREQLEVAREELVAHERRFASALDTCAIHLQGAEDELEIRGRNDATLERLASQKLTADIASFVGDAVGDCAQIAVNIDHDSRSIPDVAAGLVGCAGYAARALGQSYSAEFESDMEELEREYATGRERRQSRVAYSACLSDADMEIAGAGAAYRRILAALTELEAAALRVDNLKREAQQIHEEARATLAALQGANVTPPAYDLWSADELAAAVDTMRLARRVTYLAVRAVEYEAQQSLALRADVLDARLPSQLEQVVQMLRTSIPRSVNGRPPAELKVVLSLRDDVLQVSDRSNVAETEQNLTDTERFRLALVSPRFAEYDDEGRWVGQRIPFTLMPLGQTGTGDARAIPLLTGSDCAERIWSANASIVGEAGMVVGSGTTLTRIDLRKRNTFASQWCRTPAAGAPDMQWASVRPSRNLFADPTFEAPVGLGGSLGVGNEADAESFARIEAYHGVTRAELEGDAYESGSTSELAGRGLYGDYALFIPAAMISRDGSPGLKLQAVDDILIRIDYVSVAR